MPSYDYECKDCQTKLSETRSISAPEPEHLCNTCGKKMTKVYSIGAVTFNGSGFYRTDNK